MCAIFLKTGDDDAVDAGVGFSSVPRSLNTMRRTLDTKSDSPTDRSLGSGSQGPQPLLWYTIQLGNLTRVDVACSPYSPGTDSFMSENFSESFINESVQMP